ncbi:uncharacterized protein LOC108664325 [Hyalella azteca]|uniref:Uncharacterized protein LOC108664325 n=1 Tax=Hyalella azteca TaxID=294128 RepID=A0A8B7MYJ4_HYAAZ|nr:uncharacterized protein LOC108664325 [Hyalella azteca]
MHEPTSRGRSISSADLSETYERKRVKEILSFDSPGSIEVHLDLNEDPGIDENNVEFDEEDVVPELEKKGKQFGFPGQAYNFLPLGPGPLLGGAPPPIRPEINSPRPSRGRYSYRPPQHIYDPVSYDDRYNHGYNFGYGVADDNTGTYFGQVENRQQGVTQGQYFVDLPDGRRLIVRYYADRTGYYPTITYEQKPGFYVTESPQQYPDYFNPVNGNRYPSSRYPVSADNSYLYNLGPGHGIVNDQHFADNHGFHFTSAGPDHSHDADGPVFGFDRRPISVSSSGIVPPSVIDTSTIPPNFGNSFSPSQPIYPFYLPTRYPYNPFFVFAAPGQIFSQVPFTSSSNPTFGLDQPSFASDKPASVPNFGINPTLVNREQRLNSFRPISNDKFGFLTRNSENEQHLTGTIEDQIKGSKRNSDFNRVGNDEVNAQHGKTIASTLSFEETPDSFFNEEY